MKKHFILIINFFYLNDKLQKRLIEDFAESLEEASEILGVQSNDLPKAVQKFFEEWKSQQKKARQLSLRTHIRQPTTRPSRTRCLKLQRTNTRG